MSLPVLSRSCHVTARQISKLELWLIVVCRATSSPGWVGFCQLPSRGTGPDRRNFWCTADGINNIQDTDVHPKCGWPNFPTPHGQYMTRAVFYLHTFRGHLSASVKMASNQMHISAAHDTPKFFSLRNSLRYTPSCLLTQHCSTCDSVVPLWCATPAMAQNSTTYT